MRGMYNPTFVMAGLDPAIYRKGGWMRGSIGERSGAVILTAVPAHDVGLGASDEECKIFNRR
jgi:hypothetical protein